MIDSYFCPFIQGFATEKDCITCQDDTGQNPCNTFLNEMRRRYCEDKPRTDGH